MRLFIGIELPEGARRAAAEDALAVFEHDRRLPPAPGGWTARDVRGYGDTALTFFQAAKEARTDADGALSGKL